MGNVPSLPIPKIFHPRAFNIVINLGMVVTCTPKRPMVHSPMRKRASMLRLMLLLEKNE
jgi:hypothetical protein